MRSGESSTVRRLEVVEVTAPPPAPTAIEPVVARDAPVPPSEPKADRTDAMIAAFSALGYALSARALLCIAVIGAFIVAVLAMLNPSWMRLAALVAYGALTVVPCALLEFYRREGR